MKPASLRTVYAEFNARFWGGGLPHAQRELTIGGDRFTRGVNVRRVGCDPIRGTRGLRCRGASGFVSGVFKAPAQHWPAEIRVLSPLGAEGERRVLLHEMCHAAVWFAGHHGEGHGPRFIAELERLASLGEAWAAGEATRYAALAVEPA